MTGSSQNLPSLSEAEAIAQGADNPHGMNLLRLVMYTITLIIGAGVFSLAGDMAASGASGRAIITAWCISAFGVLCLVLTFYTLSRAKPELKGGIYSYASDGFGKFIGFLSAWGYWISAMFCTVSFVAMLFSALGHFFPIFGTGNNLPSVVGGSIIIWFYAWVVSHGVKEAAGVNVVVTFCKLIPLLVAICVIITFQAFDPAIFVSNLNRSAAGEMPFTDQVTGALVTTVWVFIGIEGAVAISGRAKHHTDVGRATIIAFLCVLTLYVCITLLALGVMPIEELAKLSNPSLADILRYAVGDWGAVLINVGVSVSIIGAMLGYTVLSSEVAFEAAERGVFLKLFTKTNANGAPIATLVISNVVIECFLVVMLFSSGTYQFFYHISSGMILLPYLFSTAYLLKIAITQPQAFKGKIGGAVWFYGIVGVLGVAYSLLLLYSTGIVGFSITSFLYAPGIIVYVVGRRERGEKFFQQKSDWIALAVIAVALIAAIYFMATGQVV